MNIGDLLFDVPWWFLCILAMAGFGLLLTGNSRQNRQFMRAGGGVILVGMILMVLSMLVETGKKQVRHRTGDLINAVVAQDQKKVRELLDSQLQAYDMDADEFAADAAKCAADAGIASAHIRSLRIQEEADGTIRVELDVTATFKPESSWPALPTTWDLRWIKSPGHGYLLLSAQCLTIYGQDATAVTAYIMARKGVK